MLHDISPLLTASAPSVGWVAFPREIAGGRFEREGATVVGTAGRGRALIVVTDRQTDRQAWKEH